MIMELPPRARRIHLNSGATYWATGTTSACAENTGGNQHFDRLARNYLRVRGEYTRQAKHQHSRKELPPRARRILQVCVVLGFQLGTTSACAENTNTIAHNQRHPRNYLRVRGEYLGTVVISTAVTELPPRARRIRRIDLISTIGDGTTSACAENTIPAFPQPRTSTNYLRVRGEYAALTSSAPSATELPPRARRIRFQPFLNHEQARTTSACAENTPH